MSNIVDLSLHSIIRKIKEIPPPTNLAIASLVYGTNATISWDSLAEATEGYYYEVYKNGALLLTDNTLSTSASISSFNYTAGDTIYFKVQIRKTNKHFSEFAQSSTSTVSKANQTAPSAPTLSSKTSTSIVLNAISGCEYKIDTGAWQASTTFSGLSMGTAYTFYARKAETATYYASASSAGTSLTTDKGTQTAPSAPTLSSRTQTSIVLNAISGCEYKRDTGAWQSSTTFSGLVVNTTYAFYARKAETATYYASASSAGANLITMGEDTSGSPGPTGLLGGDTTEGYFGRVPSSELISGTALATAVGLSAGVSINPTVDWLKFIRNGKILFSPMKSFRSTLSWNNLNAANIVTGGKTIVIGGKTYKVRLWSTTGDGEAYSELDHLNNSDAHYSEWNLLMLPIHINAPSSWSDPRRVESPTASWGGPTEDWGIDFTSGDLGLSESLDNGCYVWCKENSYNQDTGSYQNRVIRGKNDSSYLYWYAPASAWVQHGWRPVLELV